MNKKIEQFEKICETRQNYYGHIEVRDMDQEIVKSFFSLPKRQQGKKINYFTDCSKGYLYHRKNKYLGKIGNPNKTKKEVKGNLKDALKILNNLFTLNKNVKKKAYILEHSEYCYKCGREKSEGEDKMCPEHDWDDCRYENTTVDYTLRDKEYNVKTMLLITVIRMISKNRLPIKYGKNKGIIYFEYLGKQVSFHDDTVNCKPYNGVWSETKNKKIPFII